MMKKKEKGGERDEVSKFIKQHAHFFTTKEGLTMVEVNIHNLGDGCNLESKFSVRNNTGRELVIFGQDEAIFRTTHLTTTYGI